MDVNTLIVDLELSQDKTDEELITTYSMITTQVKYLSSTIDDFRCFFKPEKEKTLASVCSVLENAMAMIKATLDSKNITVSLDLDCNNKVAIIPNELLQVFINILNNAKDALIDSKTEDPQIEITIKEDKGSIITSIYDNGGNIPLDVLEHLGEPYVSTKSKNGTGLGVYISKVIVEKHLGGTLTWKNRDLGTCFNISFPIEKS